MEMFVNDMWSQSLIEYKNNVRDYNGNVGDEIIPHLANVLNRDIYLMKNGQVKLSDVKDRTSIVIEQLSDNEFVTVGRTTCSGEIEWSFEPDDVILENLTNFTQTRLVRSPMSEETKNDKNENN
jgi:hypothetical protein